MSGHHVRVLDSHVQVQKSSVACECGPLGQVASLVVSDVSLGAPAGSNKHAEGAAAAAAAAAAARQ